VYGIVKQSDGYISVESDLGRGTEFRIYFPCTAGEGDKLSGSGKEEQKSQGAATVLIIEDESSVRRVAARVLRERGYTVLEASGGAEAMRTIQDFVGEIHLVLTDVVMPGMNGREIVSQIAITRPGIKALFVSGYAGDAIAYHGGLDSHVAFLQKPFTAEALASKVREVLG
jgi:CheY-like chemotaxis protein